MSVEQVGRRSTGCAVKKEDQMKTPRTLVAMIFGICLLSSQPLFAQRGMQWRGGGGWGPGTPYARMYDPKTVQTISGSVVSVDTLTPMAGM